MNRAKIIDGKAFAANLRTRIQHDVETLSREHSIVPGLAVLLVGEDAASQVYVRSKRKQTAEVGMNSFAENLPASTSQSDLLARVDELNADPRVNGILVQLPLPAQISDDAVINAIDPRKDVDGFHIVNTGRMWSGGEALVPCTPLGCSMLLKDRLGDLSGMNVVVVGRSNIVGKPMASLLIRENCTVTIAHSRTRDLPAVCRTADILIAAVGRPELVRGDWIRPGATVIDVGINRVSVPGSETGATKLVGDVCFHEAKQVAGAITPVPGGVGPMTIACLLQNAVTAACRQNDIVLTEST